MQTRLRHTRRLDVLAIILLATFIFRSYIPVGFMPASGTPFLLELCPAFAGAMPMPAHPEHHHHSQTHTDFQDCPFGSAPAPGPIPQSFTFEPPGGIKFSVDIPAEPQRLGIRPLRAYQSRGPPSLV